jgi:membrane protease YdiL (CAAX protease family)
MAPALRTYIGPAVFILYISNWIGLFILTVARHFSVQGFTVAFIPFLAALIILPLVYRRLAPPQKQFIRVAGEVYLLFFLIIILFEIFFREFIEYNLYGLAFNIMLVLLILFYHLIVNKKTVEDLRINPVGKDTEYVIVAVIGLFCMFLALNWHSLLQYGILNYPTFEEISILVLVVIYEEIMFRYYIQQEASTAFGEGAAIVIVSILCALLHFFATPFNARNFVIHFVRSLIYSYGYSRNRNLSVPLILHAVTNLLYYIFF